MLTSSGIADICYWTIFTDLALSLFYFSVWELGPSLGNTDKPRFIF